LIRNDQAFRQNQPFLWRKIFVPTQRFLFELFISS
jgi:hypothetical protein